MVHQVDLHATDVDGPHAAGLQVTHGGNRILLGGEELASPLGIDGPWPGPDDALVVQASALNFSDGPQQPGGQPYRAFRVEDCGIAIG